jgi:hypothetical protein
MAMRVAHLTGCHECERSSPLRRRALIRLHWLERARERARRNPVEDSGDRLVAGVEVGGGEAETVVYVCESTPQRRKIITMGAWRAADTRGRVVRFLEPYRERLSIVRVDAIGIGYNFGLHLQDQKFPVELINVSRACESKPKLRERDPAQRFVNQKAWFYQELADALERDQVEGLQDDATIGQLAGIAYEVDPQGRIKIESKERARERGVQSPDRAEALIVGPVQTAGKNRALLGLDLPRLRSESGADPFDDDYERFINRRRRNWDILASGSLAQHIRRGGW